VFRAENLGFRVSGFRVLGLGHPGFVFGVQGRSGESAQPSNIRAVHSYRTTR